MSNIIEKTNKKGVLTKYKEAKINQLDLFKYGVVVDLNDKAINRNDEERE